MIKQKFSKTFNDVLTQAYLFQSELVIDQALFTAASPMFIAPFAADMLTDIQAADAVPTNEDDLNCQTLFTQEVEDEMVLARAQYQKLLLYVGMAWPASEAMLKVFGNSQYEVARRTPAKMANLLQSSYASANSVTYKATLIAAGFLQADITLLNTLHTDLTTKINAQQDFIRHSFTRTEERIVAFNKVWDSMVLISNASKLIFKDSPAKIEFYLLYPSTGGGGGPLVAVTGLTFDPMTCYFTWDTQANATSYKLEVSANNVDFMQVYAGSDATCHYQPIDGISYFRCAARNSGGFGDFGSTVTINYAENLATPTGLSISLSSSPPYQITVNWNAVTGADWYNVYTSVVNSGQAAGTFSLHDEPTTNAYSELGVTGKRHYYYIVAASATKISEASVQLFIDVP